MSRLLLAWLLGSTLVLPACAPQVPLTVPRATTALQLTFESPWRAPRALFAVEAGPRLRVTIDGPEQGTPYEHEAAVDGNGTRLTLPDVPTGPKRVITVESLDADGAVIPGSAIRAVADLASGANAVTLSARTTALGEVAAALLAMDRAEGSSWLEGLDVAGLSAMLTATVTGHRAAHFALLDTQAIAQALRDAGGALPAADDAFVRAPGRVVFRPVDWPPGLKATVTVGDPVSAPQAVSLGAPVVLGTVAPGDWTLTVTPDDPTLEPIRLALTVPEGGTVEAAAGFGTAEAGPATPAPLIPAAGAAMTVDGTETLFAIGGLSYQPGDGVAPTMRIDRYTAADGWQAGPAFGHVVLGAAAVAEGDRLFWFGGWDSSRTVTAAFSWRPGETSAPASIAPMPRALAGASAAAIEGRIYLAGGLARQSNGELFTLSDGLYAYDPVADSWSDGLPAMPAALAGRAGAVAGGRWYLFGGGIVGEAFDNGKMTPGVAPAPDSHVLIPGDVPRWESRASMPTPRVGATAVAVDGKIWVIGGVTARNVPSRAVEVYDPTRDAWEIRPPLREARAFAACGLVDGQIVVAGGTAGLLDFFMFGYAYMARPLQTVEVLRP